MFRLWYWYCHVSLENYTHCHVENAGCISLQTAPLDGDLIIDVMAGAGAVLRLVSRSSGQQTSNQTRCKRIRHSIVH
jgi:hypothetical protein